MATSPGGHLLSPENLKAKATGPRNIRLNWDPSPGNPMGYKVHPIKMFTDFKLNLLLSFTCCCISGFLFIWFLLCFRWSIGSTGTRRKTPRSWTLRLLKLSWPTCTPTVTMRCECAPTMQWEMATIPIWFPVRHWRMVITMNSENYNQISYFEHDCTLL